MEYFKRGYLGCLALANGLVYNHLTIAALVYKLNVFCYYSFGYYLSLLLTPRHQIILPRLQLSPHLLGARYCFCNVLAIVILPPLPPQDEPDDNDH